MSGFSIRVPEKKLLVIPVPGDMREAVTKSLAEKTENKHKQTKALEKSLQSFYIRLG